MTVTFDLRCGVSGDMLLGSLMDMYSREGDVDAVLNAIERAATVMSTTDVTLSRVIRNGVEANALSVNWEPMRGETVGGREMMGYLERGIQVASLGKKGASLARSILIKILEGEMDAHLKGSIDEVHLHETGTPDTLVDIIGISILYEKLELFDEWVHATPLSLGKGTVDTEHGTLDVPVPAVRPMIRNVRTRMGPVEGELATPTGVAAITSIVEIWQADNELKGEPVGRGAGTREFDDGFNNILTIYQED